MSTIIKAGSWWIVKDETKPLIECPKCGCGLLGDTAPHGIKKDGSVFRSVVCKCGFHDYVKIEGWTGGNIPHK